MIIRPVSDIHSEFFSVSGKDELEKSIPYMPNEQDMILVLAGDITANLNDWLNSSLDIYTPWLHELTERHKAVVYVIGNHEGYHSSREEALAYWKYFATKHDNMFVLENESMIIDGVRFLGTTLYTELRNPMEELTVQKISDFDLIRKFTVAKWKYAHLLAVEFLDEELPKDFSGETVVVSHFLPSFECVNGQYIGDNFNCAYASNLDRLMWYQDIKYWFHGHTHNSVDITIGDEVKSTKVICNPRGYAPDHINFNYNPTLTVEV